ncbi:pantoate kinase [Methanotorris formicicus]|uniref:Pantoate kinase n=1 Tax=Methanotorris formicicus Mc-S-70 TaxID=647171 RepID=H1L1L5_9EURY|nr:pantoate kinase [Methanotorris formicicus]EHP83621.1 GHMP kinase [Methanotorris formicicus Mc-S-70]
MFVPAHITGFFRIFKDKDFLKTGSTGAGITLNKGVYTTIKVGNGNIYFNDKKINLSPTREVMNYFNVGSYDVIHSSDFPLGSGLGTSGSCALGTAYEIFKTIGIYRWSNNYNNEPVKAAHIAEVKCGTGLGDVIAQHTKGFVIRKSPGFPINVEKVKVDNNHYVVVEILGEKETKNIINNQQWVEKINKTSDKLLIKLLKNPTLKNFMDLSFYFAETTGLISDEILEICRDLKFTVGASQAMLGNTLFCICKKEDLNDVLSILKNPIVCKIYM